MCSGWVHLIFLAEIKDNISWLLKRNLEIDEVWQEFAQAIEHNILS